MLSQNLRLDINLHPPPPPPAFLAASISWNGMNLSLSIFFLSCFLVKRWGWNGWSSGSMWNSCCAALWIPRSVFLQLSDPRPLFQSLYVRYTTFSHCISIIKLQSLVYMLSISLISVCISVPSVFCFLKVWFYVRCKNRLNIYTEIPSQQECFEFWESRQNGDLRLCSTKFDFVL